MILGVWVVTLGLTVLCFTSPVQSKTIQEMKEEFEASLPSIRSSDQETIENLEETMREIIYATSTHLREYMKFVLDALVRASRQITDIKEQYSDSEFYRKASKKKQRFSKNINTLNEYLYYAGFPHELMGPGRTVHIYDKGTRCNYRKFIAQLKADPSYPPAHDLFVGAYDFFNSLVKQSVSGTSDSRQDAIAPPVTVEDAIAPPVTVEDAIAPPVTVEGVIVPQYTLFRTRNAQQAPTGIFEVFERNVRDHK